MSTRYPTSTGDEVESAVAAAALAIQRGGLVVLPTDTVYGVGADAFDHDAVSALLDAKGRGRDMPPPVLISSATTLSALTTAVPPYVELLTDAFWPGPLTLVCTQQTSLTWDLGETRGTVAVRMPDHAIALALLERTGPMAVSSANLSGRPAATDAAAADDMLGEAVEVTIDGGISAEGEASTILDVRGPRPKVLRLGALSLEAIDEALESSGVTVLTDPADTPADASAVETADHPAEATDQPAAEAADEPVDGPAAEAADQPAPAETAPPEAADPEE